MANYNRKNNLIEYLMLFSIKSVLAIYAILVFLMNFVPPFMRDELTHHLFVPKLWIAKGKIFQIPDLLPSYYPMNIDLLYVVPLYFGNDIIPKFIHYAFGLSTAWLIYAYLEKKINSFFALLGALLFLSTPVILKLSVSAYVDLGLIFFSWASFYFLIKWSEEPNHNKLLIISAILCGLACGTKYNGLIVLMILTLNVPILYLFSGNYSYSNQITALRKTFLFCSVSIIIFSPWMIKNYIWTNNPLYPLYQNKIAGQDSSLRFSVEPLLQRKLIYKESPLETLLIPIRIFFQGKDDSPKFFDGQLNPFLLLFAIIPFFLKKISERIRKEQMILGIYALVFLLFVYFTTDMRIRYIAPILPPVVILSTFGINSLFNLAERNKWGLKNIFRTITFAIVIIMISINTVYLLKTFSDINPMPYIFGKISKETYLEKRLPEYNTIRYANKIMKKGNKLFALFLGNKGYYFDNEVLFLQNTFNDIAESYSSDRPLSGWLDENRFTHVIVGVKPFKKWVKKNFSRNAQLLVNELFLNDLKLLYYNNGYALFEIKNKNV